MNAANGNNTNFTFMQADDNPNLTCIEVDDFAYSASNWIYIDSTAQFSEDCSLSTISVDEITRANVVVFPNPTTHRLYIDGYLKIERVEVFDLKGKQLFISGTNPDELDISNLEKGTYVLKIWMLNNFVLNRKIIVQ